tara:strand:+ start:525 stop:755 length:231 start_codon:yes stop_codon:yes gene_type:complete
MNKIKMLMLKHPFISTALILPASLFFVFAVLDLIINIIIPFILALWLTSWVYSVLVGSPFGRSINEPFWFIKSQRH